MVTQYSYNLNDFLFGIFCLWLVLIIVVTTLVLLIYFRFMPWFIRINKDAKEVLDARRLEEFKREQELKERREREIEERRRLAEEEVKREQELKESFLAQRFVTLSYDIVIDDEFLSDADIIKYCLEVYGIKSVEDVILEWKNCLESRGRNIRLTDRLKFSGAGVGLNLDYDDIQKVLEKQVMILFDVYISNKVGDGVLAKEVRKYIRSFTISYAGLLRINDDLQNTAEMRRKWFEEHKKEQRRKMTPELRKKIMQRDDYTCQICGKTMYDEVGLHIDHIIPVAKGGLTEEDNLQVLCSKCNGSKSDKSDFSKDEVACSKCGKPVKMGMFCQFCGTKN